MADWFKVDAHLLEDPKVRYCMSIDPKSISVFIWCLSECCRERSDRFEWSNLPAELRGLGLVLNMSDTTVTLCLTALNDSTLIKVTGEQIIVKRWEKHQSDYLNRREYFADRYKNKNSTVKHSENSESTDFTQRRGDKNRVQVQVQSPNGSEWLTVEAGSVEELRIPEKFILNHEFIGKWDSWVKVRRAKKKCKDFHRLFQEQLDWLSGFTVPEAIEILSLSIRNDYQGLFPPKNGNGSVPTQGVLAPIDKSILLDNRKRHEARLATIRSQYDSHQTWSPKDKSEAIELKNAITQIDEKLNKALA